MQIMHLFSAEALFKLIRERCPRLPDARAVPVEISLADALLTALVLGIAPQRPTLQNSS